MKRISVIALFLLSACTVVQAEPKKIIVDGSSTVYPISEAMAEEYRAVDPKIQVLVGSSGTGGGFKKFSSGEIPITGASRRIDAKEAALAAKNKIEYIELSVAYDGITVVVNPANDFVKELSFADLKKLWEPNSSVKTWRDLNAAWPDKPVRLYGPGADSGTFDFFTEAVIGKAKLSRNTYTASEDDNVLVRGISGDVNSLGYFGYEYYIMNQAKLKAVPIKKAGEAITPSVESINSGKYPLSRPLYIYVAKAALKDPTIKNFTDFYLKHAGDIARQVGCIPLNAVDQSKVNAVFKNSAG